MRKDVGLIGWFDLTVPNAGKVKDFYAKVVGWKPEPVSMGDYDDYNMNQPLTGSKPNIDKIQNIKAAVSHSNPVPDAIGHYVFELRHPWHGHDKLDDIQLFEGDTIAFRIMFHDGLASGGGTADRHIRFFSTQSLCQNYSIDTGTIFFI